MWSSIPGAACTQLAGARVGREGPVLQVSALTTGQRGGHNICGTSPYRGEPLPPGEVTSVDLKEWCPFLPHTHHTPFHCLFLNFNPFVKQTLKTRMLKDKVVGMMANSGGCMWVQGLLSACTFARAIPPPGMPSRLSPSSEPNTIGVVLPCAVRWGPVTASSAGAMELL